MLGVSTRRRCTTIPSLLCRANVHVGLGQLKVLAAFREKSLISHSPKHGTSISFHLPPESSAIRPWFKPLHSAARLFNTSTSQAPLTEEDFFVPQQDRQNVFYVPIVPQEQTLFTSTTPSSPPPKLFPLSSSNKPITWKVEDLTTIEKANRLMKNLTMEGELHSARHLFKALPKTNLTPNTASFKIYFEHLFMARDLQFLITLAEDSKVQFDNELFIMFMERVIEFIPKKYPIARIVQCISKQKLELDADAHNSLTLAYAAAEDSLRAWFQFQEMQLLKIQPRLEVYRALLNVNPSGAFKMHNEIIQLVKLVTDKSQLSKREIEAVVRHCTTNDQLTILEKFLDFAEKTKISLDEELLCDILSYAGTRWHPEFTAKILAKIKQKNAANYAALVTSQANAGQLSAAFRTLDEMAAKGFALPPGARRSMINALARNTSHILEITANVHKHNNSRPELSLTSMNLILAALAQSLNSRKALEFFASMEMLNVKPDRESFHALLKGLSLVPGNLFSLVQVFGQFQKYGLEPTAKTFHYLIAGCLVNQELKHAWKMLEIAKNRGLEVSYKTYSMLVRKAVRLQDQEFQRKILDAMEECGLSPKEDLLRYMSRPRTVPPDFSRILQEGEQGPASS